MRISYEQNQVEIGNIVLGANFKKELLSTRDVESMLNIFFEKGGKCIDIARSYNNGLSEVLVGRWLMNSGLRNKIIVSTKGGHPQKENCARLSRNAIELDLDASLKALKTDYVDLYWLHRDDENLSTEEIVDYLNSFVKAGKIKFFGASNWSFHRLLKANTYAKRTGQMGFSCSQIQWSVGTPNPCYYDDFGMKYMNVQEYNLYKVSKFPLFVYSSQAKGFFYYINNKRKFGYQQEKFDNEINREIYKELYSIAKKYNVPLSYPVLGFILSSPLNVVPIVGCRTEYDLIECFSAIKFQLQKKEYQNLYDIQRKYVIGNTDFTKTKYDSKE